MKQKGFAHLQLIAGLVLTLSLVSFAAYRVGQSNSTSNNNNENDQTIELAEGIEIKEEETKEITVPKEETEKTAEPEAVVPKPVESKPSEPAPVKKDKVYLSMKSVSASQDGSIVYVKSKIERAVSGTCNFKLYREGFEKLMTSNKISNSQDCIGQIDVTSMPNYEGWSLYVWFDGDDGKTYAYQDNIDNFNLTNPN